MEDGQPNHPHKSSKKESVYHFSFYSEDYSEQTTRISVKGLSYGFVTEQAENSIWEKQIGFFVWRESEVELETEMPTTTTSTTCLATDITVFLQSSIFRERNRRKDREKRCVDEFSRLCDEVTSVLSVGGGRAAVNDYFLFNKKTNHYCHATTVPI